MNGQLIVIGSVILLHPQSRFRWLDDVDTAYSANAMPSRAGEGAELGDPNADGSTHVVNYSNIGFMKRLQWSTTPIGLNRLPDLSNVGQEMKKPMRELLWFVMLYGAVHTRVGAEMEADHANVKMAAEIKVRTVFEAFVKAQNAHDLEAVGMLLLDSPEFLWITRGTSIWGRDTALKRFEILYQGTWHLEPEIAALRLVLVRDHAAQIFVPIIFTIGTEGQANQQIRFLMNMWLVEVDGVWKIATILPIPASVPVQ